MSAICGQLTTRTCPQVTVFACPLCDHTTKRFTRLYHHGESKHGLRGNSGKCRTFKKMCWSQNARGVRFTTLEKITSLLGKYAQSASHINAAKIVLRKHSVRLKNEVLLEDLPTENGFVCEPMQSEDELDNVNSQSPFFASRPKQSENNEYIFSEDGLSTNASLQSENQNACINSEEGVPTSATMQSKIQNDLVNSESPAHPKRQRLTIIEKAGMVSKFNSLCRTAQVYLEVERTTGNRSIQSCQANAKMIHRYIEWAKSSANTREEIDILCDAEMPHEFANLLKSTFKMFTVKNHACAMVTLYDLILCSRDAKQLLQFRPAMKDAIRNAKECWNHIKCKVQRSARAEQRAITQGGNFQNAPILWLLEFAATFAPKCENIMTDSAFGGSQQDRDITRAVAACYMALHGQRLCAVLNLKKSELSNAVKSNGRYVVRIHEHKTAQSGGPAAVAFRPRQYWLIRNMADYYSHGERAFPISPSGRASKELFGPVANYIKTTYNVDIPDLTPNLVRKTIETNSFLAPSATDRHPLSVSNYLCHGKEVTDLFYRHKTDALIADQSRCVEQVVFCLAALDLVRNGRVSLPGPLGK